MSSSPSPLELSQSYIDEDIGQRIINAAVAVVVLETVSVVLRFWSRHLQVATLGRDDVLIIAVPIVSSLGSTLPKLVILAVYLRLLVQRWTRIACYTVGAIIVTALIVNVIVVIGQSSPPDYIWSKSIANGYGRGDVQAHVRFRHTPNIVTNVPTLILPLVCSS